MTARNPMLLSIPHSGTSFPDEIQSTYLPEVLDSPADTDWFVDQLYDFAEEIEVEVVMAPYSRYVIDLNRDPKSHLLYDDGRKETGLVPQKSFLGKSIISKEISQEEVKRRLQEYYWPYYNLIQKKLDERKEIYGKALLFDAHSIKRFVPTIRKEKFPDMILGSADEMSAHSSLIQMALSSLNAGPYGVNHNDPFKGGHITRYFGRPEENIHALQLEMSQDLYMDEERVVFDNEKSKPIKALLKNTFLNLIKQTEAL